MTSFHECGNYPTWVMYEDKHTNTNVNVYDHEYFGKISLNYANKIVDVVKTKGIDRGYILATISYGKSESYKVSRIGFNWFEFNFVHNKTERILVRCSLVGKNLKIETKKLIPVESSWRYTSHGRLITANDNIKLCDTFDFRLRISSAGIGKFITVNSGDLEIRDHTRTWIMKYMISGYGASANLGSPVDPGAWTSWRSIFPKHITPNLWHGFSLRLYEAEGAGLFLSVHKGKGELCVAKAAMDETGSALPSLTAVSGMYLHMQKNGEERYRRK